MRRQALRIHAHTRSAGEWRRRPKNAERSDELHWDGRERHATTCQRRTHNGCGFAVNKTYSAKGVETRWLLSESNKFYDEPRRSWSVSTTFPKTSSGALKEILWKPRANLAFKRIGMWFRWYLHLDVHRLNDQRTKNFISMKWTEQALFQSARSAVGLIKPLCTIFTVHICAEILRPHLLCWPRLYFAWYVIAWYTPLSWTNILNDTR